MPQRAAACRSTKTFSKGPHMLGPCLLAATKLLLPAARDDIKKSDEKLQAAAKARQQLREQMRADREAKKGKSRGDDISVDVYLPHRPRPTQVSADGPEVCLNELCASVRGGGGDTFCHNLLRVR